MLAIVECRVAFLGHGVAIQETDGRTTTSDQTVSSRI